MEGQIVPNDTQQWLIFAAIVQIVCSTIVAVVGLVTQKKVDDAQKQIEENTQLTQDAAHNAKMGKEIAAATLKTAKEVKSSAADTARQVQEIQGGSGLLKRKDHIEGDKETP